MVVSRRQVAGDLKGELGVTRRSARVRHQPMLVVGQLAVSLALVAGGRSVRSRGINAARADPGFALDRQLIVSLDPSLAGYEEARTSRIYQDAMLQRVRALPGVERASFASIVPFGEFQEGRTVRLSQGTTKAFARCSTSSAPSTSTRSACRCCAAASSRARKTSRVDRENCRHRPAAGVRRCSRRGSARPPRSAAAARGAPAAAVHRRRRASRHEARPLRSAGRAARVRRLSAPTSTPR